MIVEEKDLKLTTLDGWSIFSRNYCKQGLDNRQLVLIAAKYQTHDWVVYLDPLAAHDSCYKLYKDGKLFDSQPRASQCMSIADNEEEYNTN